MSNKTSKGSRQSAKEKAASLEARTQELKDLNASLSKKYNSAKAKNQAYTKKVRSLTRKVNDLRAENVHFASELFDANKDLDALKKQLNMAIQESRGHVAELEKNLDFYKFKYDIAKNASFWARLRYLFSPKSL